MVDRTDKPKIPSKFEICAALYNEFCCNQFHDTAPLKLMLGHLIEEIRYFYCMYTRLRLFMLEHYSLF